MKIPRSHKSFTCIFISNPLPAKSKTMFYINKFIKSYFLPFTHPYTPTSERNGSIVNAYFTDIALFEGVAEDTAGSSE